MLRRLLASVALALVSSCSAFAGEPARFALLIGNKAYAEKVGPLKNPHDDVALIEASLKKLGFTIAVLKDASYRAMDIALKRYVREVSRAGPDAISFFYYSGHGMSNPDTKINYLIPIDVREPDDEKIWDEAFQQNVVIDVLSGQAPKAIHFVIFDACRNELHITGPSTKALGSEKGFVAVNTTPGILIAYATAASKSASDLGEGGGPYAKALSEEILKPGIEAVSMFRTVQIRVKQSINQDPWLSFPSLPEVYLAGKVEKVEPPAVPVPSPSVEAEKAWMQVKDTTSLLTLNTFIQRFGDTFFADLAKARIVELKQAAEAEQQVANEAKRKGEEEAKAKAEIERQRLALQQQQEQEKRKEEERNRVKAEAEQAWNQVKDSASISALETFIRLYGGSFNGELAKTRAAELRQQAEEKQRAAEAARKKADESAKVAMLTPTGQEQLVAGPDKDKLTRDLQRELKRVGCDPDALLGNWGTRSKSALADFARHTYLTLAIDDPTLAALNAVTAQKARVCPLQCGKGQIENDGKCVDAHKVQQGSAVRDDKAAPRAPEIARERKPKAPRGSSGPCYSTGVLLTDEQKAANPGLCQ